MTSYCMKENDQILGINPLSGSHDLIAWFGLGTQEALQMSSSKLCCAVCSAALCPSMSISIVRDELSEQAQFPCSP